MLFRILIGLGEGGREGKGCEILKVGERTVALWNVGPLIKFPTGSPFYFLIVIREKALFYFGLLSYEFHLCKILLTTIATPTPQRKPRSYPIFCLTLSPP